MSGEVLLRGVELHPRQDPVDCRIRGGAVVGIGRRLRPRPDESVVRGDGGALLPGLADHHLHLAAMAAQRASLDVSALSRHGLASSVAQAVAGEDGWVRAVGYDDVVHGDLDRTVLDGWNRVLPVRVQHRSGALWVVNSPGLERLGALTAAHAGIEREGTGRPTGRLWRADAWLREALGGRPPSLRAVGARLAALGVTHVADATPDQGAGRLLSEAVRREELPQHVMTMAADAGLPPHPRLSIGPLKFVVADHALPDVDGLAGRMRQAHTDGRPVAVHCVTRTALALTLAALDRAGGLDGDRVEHCADADPAAAAELAARGIRVVTQPTLVALRGDDYWERVDPADRPDLWRYAGLLRAGVRVAASSDAPYGDPDPWAGLRAASERLTPSGRVLGADERVAVEVALRSMLSPLDDPGGPARRVAVGRPADLVLLDRPWREALLSPDAGNVRATFIEGRIVHGARQLG
ncbi:amidohydrolase family protein [Streptomyces sp. NBC_00103]|uniref:amidohydrolase family protein n=1 Tax=Streptomyces sp. NBC_00103 TaxID=2975653 RepID=UPI0022511369|nr:amidohydrolase family protein [Streptomyces sp. NBC_00103]MCX5374869.1 amidohydrolase family protein [Streptomyces sp. NBC_00103]